MQLMWTAAVGDNVTLLRSDLQQAQFIVTIGELMQFLTLELGSDESSI